MLDVVIPTKNREEKLLTCLNSIDKCILNGVNVYVYFDTVEEKLNFYNKFKRSWVNYMHYENYRVPNFWNSFLFNMDGKLLCYLNDDVEVVDDFFFTLLKEYVSHFPNFDGLMGINQSNLPEQNCKAAFGVIGCNYAKLFPNKQVYCPEYHRFCGDMEMYLYANEIGKFYFSEETKILHHHAAFLGHKDATHREVRKYLEKDKFIFALRQRRKLLWGKTFELIGEDK